MGADAQGTPGLPAVAAGLDTDTADTGLDTPGLTDDAAAAGLDYLASDPLRFVSFNPAQERAIRMLYNPCESLTVAMFLKGNGLGGSFWLVAMWAAIMWPTEHRLFQCRPFGPERWPFLQDLRLVTTAASLVDQGPIQKAMRLLFPSGRWAQTRGAGGYYSEGRSDTGFTWDCKTYNQTPQECASSTKGMIAFSEPPPAGTLIECITRLRGHGLCLVDMTQLDMGESVERLLDDGLVLDGQRVGDVRHEYGDAHESCTEHHGGHRKHIEIMADIAGWPEDEREARRTGKSLRLSGRIYPMWSTTNELRGLPDWHAERWTRGEVRLSSIIDPHDRKPWMMGWGATFPNDDYVIFGEWPPFDFDACKSSPVSDIETYRGIILDAEAGFPRKVDYRRMDPFYGEAIKGGAGLSIREMLARPCPECLKKNGGGSPAMNAPNAMKCPHRLAYVGAPGYSGSVNAGHTLVRAAIGNPEKGVRPKLYVMADACPNICRSIRRYAYHEEKNPLKALSERPQYVHKDGADIPRYAYLSGLDTWPTERPTVDLVKFRKHGRGTTEP